VSEFISVDWLPVRGGAAVLMWEISCKRGDVRSDEVVNESSGGTFLVRRDVAGPLHFANFIVEYAKMLLMWR
jgi:hypothetical protein